jgi:hypothetical protein
MILAALRQARDEAAERGEVSLSLRINSAIRALKHRMGVQ